jgi:metallo-beta-lactamase family protein
MLGAAISEIDLTREDGDVTKLVFSGDIGRSDMPMLKDPVAVAGADYVIMEGTYGDRHHIKSGDAKEMLYELTQEIFKSKGKLIIPAFSVGRTQEIIYRLNLLKEENRLPDIPVFVDSPLAVNATSVFRDKEHVECFDEEMINQIIKEEDSDPLAFENLHYIRKVEFSIELNKFKGPAIIISASGMCESGRILHHLKNHADKENTIVLFTGFQAPHTLGRQLLDGNKDVRIYGQPVTIRAKIAKLESSSGHADQQGLLEWAKSVAEKGHVKKIALVHCEIDSGTALKKLLEENNCGCTFLPARGESMSLDAKQDSSAASPVG